MKLEFKELIKRIYYSDLKAAFKKCDDENNMSGQKANFRKLYDKCRNQALNSKNILPGFKKSIISPSNTEGVLKKCSDGKNPQLN